MSSVDARLVHEMWTGRVPVLFSLAVNELTGLESPLPSVLLLPRYSYLPLCTDAVRRNLLPSAPAVEDEMWMEESATGCPWRWQIPIGVLADINHAKHLSSTATHYSPHQSHSAVDLPIRLTVHFQSFPNRRLLRCRSVQVVRHHLMHSIKEATFVRRGDSRAVSAAAISAHNKLWDSLLAGQDEAYQQVMTLLAGAGGGGAFTESGTTDVPIRLFLIGFLSDEAALLERERESGTSEMADMHYSPVQRPVSANEHTTLGEVLQQLLGQREGAARLLSGDSSAAEGVVVLVHGIAISHDTPIEWLYKHCAHPDAFLYLTAVRLRVDSLK